MASESPIESEDVDSFADPLDWGAVSACQGSGVDYPEGVCDDDEAIVADQAPTSPLDIDREGIEAQMASSGSQIAIGDIYLRRCGIGESCQPAKVVMPKMMG